MGRKLTGLLLSLLAIMFVLPLSGCVMPGGTSGGSGVIIENFEVDFPRIYADENFKLQMKIKNTGSVDAYNVYPKLYNIGKTVGGSTLEVSCKESCGDGVYLLAPDPERGTIGESKICIWDCKAPSKIPKGLSVTFNPSVRLYYLYETHTIKSVTIISQDELRSLQTQGKSLPSETVSTTNGPVQLDIVVNGPIRYWEGENRIKFPININIQNTGGGVTCMDRNYISMPIPQGPLSPFGGFIPVVVGGCEGAGFWNKVQLYFDAEKETNIYCSSIEGGSIQGYVIDLWKGQSTTLTCEIDMPLPAAYSSGLLQKNLKFSIYYAYFVDGTVNVEVAGRDTA